MSQLSFSLATQHKIDEEFEDYSRTSKTYNSFRRPIDISSVESELDRYSYEQSGDNFYILDIGCGTGNYLTHIGKKYDNLKLVGLERNEGMLKQAKSQSADANVDIHFIHGFAEDIPLPDASCSLVLCCQMLHHAKSAVGDIFKEAHRVLRPGGMFWIQTSLPQQQAVGFWWASIIQNAAVRASDNFPSHAHIIRLCKEVGFEYPEWHVPSETLVRSEEYLNAEGPFLQAWRDSDSTWSLATSQELEDGLDWWKSVDDKEDFLKKREDIRKLVGQTVTFRIRKKHL